MNARSTHAVRTISRALPRARLAVATIFFLNGLGIASWVVRIPAVQQKLALSAGELGVALLGMAAGALVAMPIAGRYVVRLGSRPVTAASALAFACTLLLPPLASSEVMLWLALFVTGLANGTLDVAMNAQAATVEREYGRPIMAGFHALFSAGGLVGSALGGAVAGAGIAPLWHLAGAAAAIVTTALVVSPRMLPAELDAESGSEHASAFTPALLRPPLLALGVLAFCVLFAEGAMADWSAVYLHDVSRASEGVAALGYAAFSVMMATGRAVGDRVLARWGARAVVRAGGVLATLGIALSIADPRPLLVAIGFGAVGAGLATAFPSVLSASSRVAGVPAGAGIALASTIGYTGFLSGPPLIGFVAEGSSLRGGLAVVGLAAVLVVALAGVLGTRSDNASPESERTDAGEATRAAVPMNERSEAGAGEAR